MLHAVKVVHDLLVLSGSFFADGIAVHRFHDMVRCPSAALHDVLVRDSDGVENGSRVMPLRYNNDKRKKPLFSRGLSVCRHLFNSFSKLKHGEKNIEKRRLFH